MFFCGAGISYDAKIPVFEGLLQDTAEGLNHELSPAEKRLFRAKRFDELYQEYERAFRTPAYVRRVSERFLHPVLDSEGRALAKHCSLLKLARAHDGATRLVTTNYDCLFDEAQKKLGRVIPSFAAPLLPIPKDYKWDGIVYLHGKLEEKPTDRNLLSLILSSGDFGQAYLTERWAARFVTELFRDHVICFVGYSVNDVILKYMMDALASEELQGGRHLPVYAFASCTKGHEEECRESWKSKGIIAIPYHITRKKGHEDLTRTLQEWARHYETGRLDKGVIIRSCLRSAPDTVSDLGRQTIGRFQWALHDEIGAKSLPEPDAITVQWIAHLPSDVTDNKVWRLIVAWVARHFNRPEALQWCVRNKGRLSEDDFNTLHWGVTQSSDIDSNLAELWRLFVSDMQRLRLNRFVDWLQLRKANTELTAGLRQMFKSLIQPTLAISAVDNLWMRDPARLRRYFEWNIVLDDGLSIFEEQESRHYLSELLPELTVALVDACSILKSLGDQDFSYMHVPSLSDKVDRVYGKQEWYYLIILIKHAVLGIESEDSVRRIWDDWCALDYPAFYRLLLWCASSHKVISAGRVVTWLGNHHEALWGDNCARELYEFLDVRATDLTEKDFSRLQRLILAPAEHLSANDYCKATRLEYLKKGRGALSDEALRFLETFAIEHADWASRNRVRDGIRVWDDDYENDAAKGDTHCDFCVPTKIDAAWRFFEGVLGKADAGTQQAIGEWIAHDPRAAIRLLLDIGRVHDYWPVALWDALFSALTGGVAKTVAEQLTKDDVALIPVKLLSDVRIRFSFWTRTVAIKKIDSGPFRDLCCRFIFSVPAEEEMAGTENANAPYELVAEALLRNWFDIQPKKGAGLSEPYRSVFTRIAEGVTLGERYARRELQHQLSGMFAVDPEWATQHLLPWLSWKNRPDLACESWNHAVMMCQYVPELLRKLWDDFVETGRRYESLNGMAQEWYAAIFFHHCLRVESKTEKRACTKLLKLIPVSGREQVARQLYLRLNEAEGKADAVWRNDLDPFLRMVWPGESKYVTERVFTHFADGLLYLDETFPVAVDMMTHFATVETRRMSLLGLFEHGIKGAGSLCARYPQSALKLLSMLTGFSTGGELSRCLDQIVQADSSLSQSDDYKRLRVEAEKHII